MIDHNTTEVTDTLGNMSGTATIYRKPLQGDYSGHERYYFACDTCGACGNHTLSHAVALDEAVWHVLNANHEEAVNG